MQFHWRLADAIFAVMWIGNIDEMYIISYCPKLSNETYYGDTAFQGNNIKIIVFQNIKFKTFVNDDSYYLCVFVFYVFWKCNSYVGIVITSKISSSKVIQEILSCFVFWTIQLTMKNIPPINAQDSVLYTIRYTYSLNMFREKNSLGKWDNVQISPRRRRP